MIEYFKKRKATRPLLAAMILLFAFTTIGLAQGGRYQVNPWSFGVHGDTQWYVPSDPLGAENPDNPNYVSAAVARALNQRFIKEGVKFVIQVGDLSDRAGDAAMYTRADVSASLYDKGIGFFPLRGNHETYGYMYFLDPLNNLNIPAFLGAFPQTQGMANTFGAANFSSPAIDALKGLSYSFDYGEAGNNARFVIVDVEATKISTTTPAAHATYGPGAFYFGFTVYKHTADLSGTTGAYVDGVWKKVPATIPAGEYFRISSGKPTTDFYGWNNGIVTQYNAGGNIWPIADNLSYSTSTVSGEYWPGTQQGWISGQLDKNVRGTEHAFVFSHRPLMGANHADGFFGSNPGSKASDQNVFYASLVNNDVHYMISGHDHIYNRALVDSPDGLSQVEQLISTGASSKFYDPASLDSFISSYGDVKKRETQISQETWNMGYYIYTVDGPRVTVDYYSDSEGNFADGDDYPDGSGSLLTPDFDFVKKETWGYSLNGRKFLVPQGGSFTVVEDSFNGTTARILDGVNNSTTTDSTPVAFSGGTQVSGPRPLSKAVNTGWVEKPKKQFNFDELKSDILSLWGMSELGAEDKTDTYVLSMSFEPTAASFLGTGDIGIATFIDGKWLNAVDENFGGEKEFVLGEYKPEYGLGTYGVDPNTNTAWAVLNYNADFAVGADINRPNSKTLPVSLLSNPGFESGTPGWTFYTNGVGSFGADAAGVASAAAGHVKVVHAGSNAQLYQEGIALEPNTRYLLSFKAYSNWGHDVEVSLIKHGAPYTNYGLSYYRCDLASTWTDCTVQFTTTGFSGNVNDARLMFWLPPFAQAGDQYFFDNVLLVKAAVSGPPAIMVPPYSRTVAAARTETFTVVASGAEPFSYQWRRDGIEIPGATGASYTTRITSAEDNSVYDCAVANSEGRSTSGWAIVATSTLLANPGFESGVNPWEFYAAGAGSFDNDAPGEASFHAGHAIIAKPGANIQLYQAGIALRPNTRYRLSFKAYSNQGHDLAVSLFKHDAPLIHYGLTDRTFDLADAWGVYSVEFKTPGFFGIANDARLMFWLSPFAAAGDEYFLDDILLEYFPY